MKILVVNTSESVGGAAIGAHRLVQSLQQLGVEVNLMVLHKSSDTPYVIGSSEPWRAKWNFIAERIRIWIANGLSRKNLFTVSIANTGTDITQTEAFRQADIIHLQWINQGMLSTDDIERIAKSGKPVAWTMHDMWELTGICHHALGCTRYREGCGQCPLLRFPKPTDLSATVLQRKLHAMHGRGIHYVAVSRWLADRAKESTLLGGEHISVIPNSLVMEKFPMTDRQQARNALGIRQKHVLIFGAVRIDLPIKGFQYLTKALQSLVERNDIRREDLHIIIFGTFRDDSMLKEIPISFTHVGPINSEQQLAQYYSASDVLVSSSLYETFGQTLIEAQACGCTPVSFEGSGQADIIRHGENGYLAQYLDSNSLADGIAWALKHDIPRESQRTYVAKHFASDVVAWKYLRLYEEILSKR